MKNKDLVLSSFYDGCVVLVMFILISLLFETWPVFHNNRSLGDIIVQALILGIVYSLANFFYARKRLKHRQTDKNKMV